MGRDFHPVFSWVWDGKRDIFVGVGRVENSVLLKCRKLRREDPETSDWIVSRISLFYDMSLVSVVIEISS